MPVLQIPINFKAFCCPHGNLKTRCAWLIIITGVPAPRREPRKFCRLFLSLNAIPYLSGFAFFKSLVYLNFQKQTPVSSSLTEFSLSFIVRSLAAYRCCLGRQNHTHTHTCVSGLCCVPHTLHQSHILQDAGQGRAGTLYRMKH